MTTLHSQRYIVAFIITAFIFGTALVASDTLSNRKVAELNNIQDQIYIDILSLETQFDLLQESSCSAIGSSVLSQELNNLAEKLSYAESQNNINSTEIERLKKYYSLLQIKDYMLMKQVSSKCDLDPVFILYFYSNEGDCDDCKRQGYALTYLREHYPQLRVYAFDYNLNLNALSTLITVSKTEKNLPALVMNDKVYYGFQSIEAIEKALPELSTLSTSTATTTKTKK